MTNDKFRELIKISGLTNEQLCEKLDISIRTLYRYLSGDSKIPIELEYNMINNLQKFEKKVMLEYMTNQHAEMLLY